MDEARARRLTALFTKRPAPGRVKTRLSPPLTPVEAAELAEAMLRDAVERSLAGAFRSVLAFAPEADAPWFRARFPELVEQVPQRGAGLGQRLAHFAEDAFAAGDARTLVIVGSDQPLVPLARLHEAHAALEAGAGCVLGPDHGGGYYLIGLARSVPELFTEVPMSSSGTCAATEALARARGLALVRLAEHADVDVPADLERLCAELPETKGEARHTRAALERLARFSRA